MPGSGSRQGARKNQTNRNGLADSRPFLDSQQKIRSAARRNRADVYFLTSLVSSAATVIVTRAFLELTGYHQTGYSVLLVAHVLLP